MPNQTLSSPIAWHFYVAFCSLSRQAIGDHMKGDDEVIKLWIQIQQEININIVFFFLQQLVRWSVVKKQKKQEPLIMTFFCDCCDRQNYIQRRLIRTKFMSTKSKEKLNVENHFDSFSLQYPTLNFGTVHVRKNCWNVIWFLFCLIECKSSFISKIPPVRSLST